MNSHTHVLPELAVRVARRHEEAVDICSFELVPCEGHSLPRFTPGSHVVVHVSDVLSRAYSLCNDAAESHRYAIAVLRDPATRGGSAAMHDTLQTGSVVKISPPRNCFELVHSAPFSLLLAGGIGITPIISMAEHLSKAGAPFALHYCTRSPERTAFRERLAEADYRDRVHHHFDGGPPAQRMDIGATLDACPPGSHVYVCGPKGFIDAVVSAAGAKGWPSQNVHFESFSIPVLEKSVGDETGSTFEVELAKSGRVVVVPREKTVVQALADVGVNIETSCEQGVCGVCITRVLAGVPDHRDMVLTDEEHGRNDEFTPCCSRSCSPRLVLDL